MSITGELQRTFRNATLQHLAEKHLNRAEWRQFQKIQKNYAEKRQAAEAVFENEYTSRVEREQRCLIDQRGSKTRDHKHPWFGYDQFDNSAIDRQAHRTVNSHHMKRMAGLDQREEQDVQQLVNTAQARETQRGIPSNEFNQSADRRLGVDRRSGKDRRRSVGRLQGVDTAQRQFRPRHNHQR